MIEQYPYIEVTLNADSAPNGSVVIRVYNEAMSTFGSVNPADIASAIQALLKSAYTDWTDSTKTYHEATSTNL